MKKKCKVKMWCDAIVYVEFNSRGDAEHIDEVDEIGDIDDFEIKEIIY